MNNNNPDKEFFEHFRFEIDKGQGPIRIDKFLKNKIPFFSRNMIQKSTKANFVLVNNNAVKPHYRVKPEDIITVIYTKPPRDKEISPEEIPLDIIFEDEYLLVINKAAGMVVHPTFNNYSGTMVNALTAHFNKSISKNKLLKPGLVHRIDKDTSGLMVVAKEKNTMNSLYEQFYFHTIKRKYLALVWGNFKEDSGTITGKLVKNSNKKNYSNHLLHKEGKEGITHYNVLEKFEGLSLIECSLETGRTHQIRAHMKFIGHPLFNDTLYEGNQILYNSSDENYNQLIKKCMEILPRQALHAKSIGFVHPISQKEIYFESEIPDDINSVLNLIRKYH